MIDIRDVSKRFVIHHQRATELKERIVGRLKGRRFESEEFWALQHVTIQIRQGESVALIGANGSGKSTLLQLVARILVPDTGSVQVTGRVSALLELGAGFNPELTGRENIYLASAIQGFSRKEIEARMAEIIEFSELERFIDTPIKNYSTGMYMRLGFSVATHVDPDLLLFDEILAVGDEAFQAKCIARIQEFKRRGRTIVFVSHSMDAVRRICDRAVLLDNGRLALDGTPDDAIRHYFGILGISTTPAVSPAAPSEVSPPPPAEDGPALRPMPQDAVTIPQGSVYLEIQGWLGADGTPVGSPVEARGLIARMGPVPPQATAPDVMPPVPTATTPGPAPARRHGIGLVRVQSVDLFGSEPGMAIQSGGPLTARIHYHAECIVKRPVVGVAIHDGSGSHLLGPNSKAQGFSIPFIEGSGALDWIVPALPLQPGHYQFTAAIFNNSIDVVYDYCERLFGFDVDGPPSQEQGAVAAKSSFSVPQPEPAEPRREPVTVEGGSR